MLGSPEACALALPTLQGIVVRMPAAKCTYATGLLLILQLLLLLLRPNVMSPCWPPRALPPSYQCPWHRMHVKERMTDDTVCVYIEASTPCAYDSCREHLRALHASHGRKSHDACKVAC